MSLPFNFSSQRLAAVTDPGVQAGGMATFELKFGDLGWDSPAQAAEAIHKPYFEQRNAPAATDPMMETEPTISRDEMVRLPSAIMEPGGPEVVSGWSPAHEAFRPAPAMPFIPPRPRHEALPKSAFIPMPAPAADRFVPPVVHQPEPGNSSALKEIQAQMTEIKLALGNELGRSEHAAEQRLEDLAAALQREIRDLNSKAEAEAQQIRDDLFSTAMGMSALRDQQQIIVAELNVVRSAVAQQPESEGRAPHPAIAGQISAMQETMATLEQQILASIASAEESVRMLNARFDSLAETSSNLRALGERVDSLDAIAPCVKALESRLDTIAVAATSIKTIQSRLDAFGAVGEGLTALEARVEMIATRDMGVLKHRTERAEERAARAIAALESISDEQKLASLWNVPEEPPEAQKFASYDAVGTLSERIDELAAKQRFSDTLLKSVELSVVERCERLVAAKLAVMADETTAELVEMESRLHREMPIEVPSVEEPEGCGLLAMDAKTEQRVVELVEELVAGKLKALVAPLVRADLSRMLGAILPVPMPVVAMESPSSDEFEVQKEIAQ